MRAFSARARAGPAVAALVAGLLVFRWVLVGAADSAIVWDEVGYIGNARHLTGTGPDVVMAGTFYRAGYSLLLAPLTWLTDSPTGLHTAGVLLNCVLLALAAALCYAVAREGFGFGVGPALAGATAAGLYPSLTGHAAVLWSESLLTALFATWALLLVRLHVTRAVGWSIAFGAAGGALYATHGRMVGVTAITGLVLAWAWGTGRIDRVRAGAGLAALAVVVVGAQVLHGALADALYPFGAGEGSGMLGRLRAGDASSYLKAGAGQAWYLVLVSLGTVVAGAWVLVRATATNRRRLWRAAPAPAPADPTASDDRARPGDDDGPGDVDGPAALGVLLASGSVAAISMLSLGTGVARMFRGVAAPRADLLVYGRYDEVWAVLLVGLGTAWLVGGARRREVVGVAALAALVLGAGALVLREGIPEAWLGTFFNPSTATGVWVWIQWVGSFSVARITALGGLLTLAVAAAALARPIGARLAVVVLVAGTFAVQSRVVSVDYVRPFTDHAHTINAVPLAVNALGIDRVGFVAPYDGPAFYLFQFWLTDAGYVPVGDGRDLPAGTEAVIAPTTWTGPAGTDALVRDDTLDVTLWVVPGPLHDRLAAAGRLEPAA